MIKVTYLDHSGFAVTLPKAILVFDYFRDPSHSLNKILGDYPALPVVFFASHRHPDHHTPSIYETAQNHRRVYVLSNDIKAKNIPTTLEVQGMSAGDYVENLPGDISVKAYPSTDEGVSFLVTLADGKKIFHAGDLNDWHWQDESTFREVEQASMQFRKILKRIADENPVIDIAFFPVDPRQGSDFERGAREFLGAVKVENFFPMHFDGKYQEACNFAAYNTGGVARCYCLHHPGHSVEIDA